MTLPTEVSAVHVARVSLGGTHDSAHAAASVADPGSCPGIGGAAERPPGPTGGRCLQRDTLAGGERCLREEGHPGGHHYIATAPREPAASGVRTHLLTAEPGNGTSYRLTVVLQGRSIKTIAWPDVGWSCGDLGSHVSAEWLFNSACQGRKRGAPAFTRADADAIAAIVNGCVS